jgi:hypothetical protein
MSEASRLGLPHPFREFRDEVRQNVGELRDEVREVHETLKGAPRTEAAMDRLAYHADRLLSPISPETVKTVAEGVKMAAEDYMAVHRVVASGARLAQQAFYVATTPQRVALQAAGTVARAVASNLPGGSKE